ncbi:MAG TPA: hypothetical protein QF564_07385 [Pirellulaceae bacterium]|nr:hypothetical protein [Pirellulaceae bacterium]
MSVFCAKCGEELLGAINRCWRCGTEYESRSGQVDIPPLRRAPIRAPLDGSLEAEIIDSETAIDDSDVEPNCGDANNDADGTQTTPMRRGSPFRTEEVDPEGNSTDEFSRSGPPAATVYPKFGGASMGSVVAITLGLLGLGLACYVPLASIIIAGFGVGMGVWGLYSKRRGAAIIGLLLCCAAITFSGFSGAVELYRVIHGVAPWESGPYPAP